MVKRFVVLTWNMNGPLNFTLLQDGHGNVLQFYRKKEAIKYVKESPDLQGIHYRAVAVWV